MPYMTSNDVQISWDDQGQGGPALLLLPGWCGSRSIFDGLLRRCSAQRRVIAPDWRGHGQSGTCLKDFGARELVDDTLAVIATSGAETVVPVALSHASWIAIELRRRLGPRIPKIVLLDTIVFDAPPPFLGALAALRDPEQWRQTREQLFSMWLHGLDIPELSRYVREDMGAYGFEMWARAGREISAAYAQAGSPLSALAALAEPLPVLHMYAQPDDPAYLAGQQAFAAAHPWFQALKLDAHSHFPMLEVPDVMAAAIERFVAAAT